MNQQIQERFEAFYQGTMSITEQDILAQQLAQDSDLAAQYQDFCDLQQAIQNLDNGMDSLWETEQQIHHYLQAKMSKKEILDFEKRIASDPMLQEQVEEQKLINAILSERENDKKRSDSTVSKTTAKIKALPDRSIKRAPRSWWAIAASIAVLVMATLWWITTEPESIDYAKYTLRTEATTYVLQEMQLQKGFASDASEGPATWLKIMEAIEQDQVAVAKTHLQHYVKTHGEEEFTKFLLAKTIISDPSSSPDEIASAVQSLQELQTTINDDDDLDWTLVMALHRLPETREESIRQLKEEWAEKRPAPYNQYAKEILQQQ